ncbi:autophagy-related protein 2 homolog A, partial [Exaiptasia diaphana]|uniref:Autophagy-related protein 2 n=1 Tax=Exaiptasia diaphana TaxID=2652724 RepID=A0A913WW15_EXADI
MPWYFPWSDSIKKRACRYLLQHYLGHFLQEKLTLEQLTVDLYNGTGRVENVPLDVWSVNEMLDSCGAPFELIDGYINKISVSVPWSALLNDSCCMDIQGLELTIAMKQRSDQGGSGLTESMIFNNMTTSMEMAQECLKQGPSPGEEQAEAATQQFEGLETFAQTIESVLSRVKLTFADIVIRLEHLPKDIQTGIGLEIHIKRVDYSDLSTELSEKDAQYKAKSVYEPAAFAFKNLKIFGVCAYLDEFEEKARTMPPGFDSDSPTSPPPSPTVSSPSMTSACFESVVSQLAKSEKSSLLPSIQIGNFAGGLEVKLKLKQNNAVTGSKVDIECFFGTLNVFLAPRQVHLLIELASALSLGDNCQSSGLKGGISVNKPMEPDDYKRIEEDLQNQLHAKKQQKLDSGHQKVETWNCNFDSSNTTDNLTHFSSSAEYDSVLGEDSDEQFYSMPSNQWNHDILPPLEEPPLPADMIKKASLLTQGFGNIPKFNTSGSSLTEAASSVFAHAQSQQSQSKPSTFTGKPKSISPVNPG